jgi:glycerol-3-phosphate dehydrogenase (NAD(P)+)
MSGRLQQGKRACSMGSLMREHALILGDGQMALVMADALAANSVACRIWSPFPDDARSLQASRQSPRLEKFRLTGDVQVTGDDAAAFRDVTFCISAIPTQFLRSAWQRLRDRYADAGGILPIVSVTKGIENATGLRPTQVVVDALEMRSQEAFVCVLSGPSVAAELARRLPASLVVAASDQQLAARVQRLLRVPWLRIYSHDDVIGVEVAGAAKNVIALAAGMLDGLGAGDNAKSALLARGLAEIARLGVAMGARVETFFGVAGVGDLATTCFSPEGRNRTCGERLGRGERLDDVLKSMKSVVEGVSTTRSLVELSQRLNVDMPISRAVHAILFEGLSPQEAIRELMSREQKAERVG